MPVKNATARSIFKTFSGHAKHVLQLLNDKFNIKTLILSKIGFRFVVQLRKEVGSAGMQPTSANSTVHIQALAY